MSKQNKITPIYARVLGQALGYVVMRMVEGQPTATWQALKTLYHVSPPNVKQDCKQIYTEIVNQLQLRATPRSLITASSQAETSTNLEKFLSNKNHEFLDAITQSLYEKGYLEWEGLKPRYPSDKKLSVEVIER